MSEQKTNTTNSTNATHFTKQKRATKYCFVFVCMCWLLGFLTEKARHHLFFAADSLDVLLCICFACPKANHKQQSLTLIFFAVTTIDLKTGGVRSGGWDDSPTWHSLTTLKALDMSAQLDFAEGLVAECKHGNETAEEFEVRAKLRWRKDTFKMLCDAEKNRCAEAVGGASKR